jgi:hypothetical protein
LKGTGNIELMPFLEKLGEIVPGEKINPNLKENCLGVLEVNTVVVCKKMNQLWIISSYKNLHKLDEINFVEMNQEERKSYSVHTQIIERLRVLTQSINNKIIQKNDFISEFQKFKE